MAISSINSKWKDITSQLTFKTNVANQGFKCITDGTVVLFQGIIHTYQSFDNMGELMSGFPAPVASEISIFIKKSDLSVITARLFNGILFPNATLENGYNFTINGAYISS